MIIDRELPFMSQLEIEKSKATIIVEIIEYIPNRIVSRTILKKSTGNITVSSLDAGEQLEEKISPFDNFIQIIDGTADIVIRDIKHTLQKGAGIVIPAHTTHGFLATVKFKMISTVIKSGYDD